MSIVAQALTAEIREAMTISKKYYDDIQTAKTNAKKTHLTKKLKRNNIKVAELIQALERLKNDVSMDNAQGLPAEQSS